MWYCVCPICKREYEATPRVCACGFEGLVSKAAFEPYESDAEGREELFRIFKFAKRVLYGQQPYEKSELNVYRDEKETLVQDVFDRRGLALVDLVATPPTMADTGLLAMQAEKRALILNTNRAMPDLLDECSAEILMFGADFSGFEHDYVSAYARPLRYVVVHGDNPHFVSEDNVMFDRKMTKLYLYAGGKPEEEYRVPKTVKVLQRGSFACAHHLKRLYLPRGTRYDDAFFYSNPAMEIIYYD